ncbi:MAG: FecR family protein, partial [Parabacteroides sp.]|nr:FecR family protein [Parabacteroides sp.]
MSPIKKILKYFFHHSFSGEMVDRVHQRLAEPGDDWEKEEALRDIWNEIGFPEADKRSEMAFVRLEDTLGVRSRRHRRIPAWVRIAAIWLIPLLSLGVSYYLYRG